MEYYDHMLEFFTALITLIVTVLGSHYSLKKNINSNNGDVAHGIVEIKKLIEEINQLKDELNQKRG